MRCAVVLVGLLGACSGSDEVEVTYDPCSPLRLVPDDLASAQERASVQEAIDHWGAVIAIQADVGGWPDDRPALPVTFESGDTFYRAVYWDSFGEIAINRDKVDPADQGIALAHELGHAFGLLHVEDRPSVMNTGNLELAPNDADADAVRGLWPACADQQEAHSIVAW
jgi:hypothetical protein